MTVAPHHRLDVQGSAKVGALRATPLALLAITPVAALLPWGGVLPGGTLRIQLLGFLCAIAALAALGLPRSRAWVVPTASAAALALVGGLQILPLGDALIRTLSPTSAEIYHETNAILASYGREAVAARISIAPAETIAVALLTAAFAAMFFAAFATFSTGRQPRRIFAWVVVFAAVAHVAGAAIFAAATTGERLHGLFINPNHLAGWLEIALMVALGLLWVEVLQGPGPTVDPERALEKRIARLAMKALPLLMIAGGIALTRSRAGIAAAAATVVLFLVLALTHSSARRRRRRKTAAGGVALAALGVVSFLALSVGGRPFLRFLAADPRDPESDLRTRLWSYAIDAWQQFPIFGSGLGSFREAFRRVQPREVPGLVEQAHSEPFQMLVTGGAVGLALSVAMIASLLVILFRLWRRQEHREESAMALAGFCAVVALLLHGLAEFNFSIPAIPALLAIVAGWSLAAAADDAPPRVAP